MGNNKARFLADVVSYSFLAIVCVFVLIPIFWTVVTSFKTVSGITAYPPQFIPRPLTVENYTVGFLSSRMPRYLWNSIFVAVSTIVGTLAIAIHAGYATARFKFPGRGLFLFAILATSMIPGIAVLVPYYLITTKVGLYDHHAALIIIYSAWQVPMITWILKAFFESVPAELEEAAFVDGCTPWTAFYKVVMPLAKPGLAAAAILIFVYVWNEFLIAHTLTLSTSNRLLTIGLYFSVTAFGINWGALTSGVTMALLPVVVVFLFLQKYFVQGLTAGAVKG